MILLQWVWNKGALNPLVGISANCSLEETNCTKSCFLATHSLTKWTSISICLVFWCWTGLNEKAIAERFSQNKTGAIGNETCRKLKSYLIQSNSAEVMDKALYSASFEDLEIVYCFFEDQHIRLDSKNTIKSVADLLSFRSLAKSASLKAFNYKSPLVYAMLYFWVPLKYLSIFFIAVKWAV